MTLTHYAKGKLSEIYVIFILVLKGYKILHWRMRNQISEIDVIATKKNTLIAIEVKYRKTFDAGLNAVTFSQKTKIRRAFELFIAKQNKTYSSFRCDVYLVSGIFKIKVLENAF